MQNAAFWDTVHSAMYFPPSSSSSYGLMTRFWLDDSGASPVDYVHPRP